MWRNFFYNLFKKNKKIEAFDEIRPTISAYYKFIKYNKINIDDEPFFKLIENDFKKTKKKGKIRLDASSYFSLHIDEFYKKIWHQDNNFDEKSLRCSPKSF